MSSAVYKVVDLHLVQEIVSLQLVEDKLIVCGGFVAFGIEHNLAYCNSPTKSGFACFLL